MIWYYLIGMNVVTFLAYGEDKRRAIKHLWRISEATLLGLAALGGAAGALAGMYLFHHKIRKAKFKYGVPLFFLVELVLICYF